VLHAWLTAAALLTVLSVAACFSEHIAAGSAAVDARAICANPASAGPGVVVIRNFAFTPASLHVAAGTPVTWVNCESTGDAHTATSNTGMWKSGLLPEFQSYTFTFPSAGTFAYFCEVHPFMQAAIVVQ
jgi:plastocyanin